MHRRDAGDRRTVTGALATGALVAGAVLTGLVAVVARAAVALAKGEAPAMPGRKAAAPTATANAVRPARSLW